MKRSQIIYINSSNRTSGTHEAFSYALPITEKYERISLLSISIPKSYYLVNSDEYFTLSENGIETNIYLGAGNFTIKSLLVKLNVVLTANSSQGWTYTATFANSSTEIDDGKITFHVTGNGGIQPQFIFNDNIYEILGFDNNSNNAFVDDYIRSQNVVKLSLEDSLYIHTTACTNKNDNILQSLTVDNSDYSFITFQNTLLIETSSKFTNQLISEWWITDETNQKIIRLNGLNWNCSIILFDLA